MRTRRWQPQQTQDALAKSATATHVPAAATSSDGNSGDNSDSDAYNSSSSGDHGDSDDGSDTIPATTRTQITNHNKKKQKRATEQKQPRAAWDDDALVCLLQLRYVEMDDHFRNECVTSADTADAWSVLANELNLRMEVAFSSLQCRSRITALRKRWDEHSIANIRNGTEQRTKHVEAIKLLTWLYRRGVVAPLQQVAKIAPRSDCRGHKRFAEGFSEEEDDVEVESGVLALRRKQQEQDVDDYEEEEEEDTTSLGDDENELQPHVDGDNGADAAAALWLSNTPLTLERRHLELFQRQVLAEEAIAQATQQRVEATKQQIRAEREQLQLSRDELELKLFTMTAAAEELEAEERVKCEFVAMKRRQVMDRLARDFVSTEQFEKEAERE